MSGRDAILGVCFDLDGTLVDSERLQWEAYRRVLADHGVDIGLDEYRRHFIAVAGGAEYACRRYALPFDAATLRARKAAVYRELIAAGVPPMPGARECLERLRDRWRLAVVTNSTRAEATTILDRPRSRRRCCTPWSRARTTPPPSPRPTRTWPRPRRSASRPRPASRSRTRRAAWPRRAPPACAVVAVPGELTADQRFRRCLAAAAEPRRAGCRALLDDTGAPA